MAMPDNAAKPNVAILISGRGTNMATLVEAAADPRYPAKIVGVLSNRPDATGLELAEKAGLQTATITSASHNDREKTDRAMDEILQGWGAQIVCMAGYMRIVSPWFTRRWQGRLINIHPSLLPHYKGLNTHDRALADGATQHGCSVHFVTEKPDDGPVIAQVAVPVMFGDTATTLADRVLAAEHRLYPMALADLATGRVEFPAPA
jgi:phosphoribosylglycinamide formyltransferase 1